MAEPPVERAGAVIDRLYDALARGDVVGARACCAPDVIIWHSYDRIETNLDESCRGWEQFINAYPERAFVDVRRTLTADGFVQRYVMVARFGDGPRRGWPICIFVTVRDGLIARLDEYMDRAGSYVIAGDAPTK